MKNAVVIQSSRYNRLRESFASALPVVRVRTKDGTEGIRIERATRRYIVEDDEGSKEGGREGGGQWYRISSSFLPSLSLPPLPPSPSLLSSSLACSLARPLIKYLHLARSLARSSFVAPTAAPPDARRAWTPLGLRTKMSRICQIQSNMTAVI